MKFTFKTIKPTGKWKSFEKPIHVIKLNKKVVGSIDSKFPFYIRLKIIKKDIMEDKNPNCKWRWIYLSHKSNSLELAKIFINDRIDTILEKYTLDLSDD
jgi:hypothetical protein